MNIGKLDRRIVVQKRTTTVDTFGQRVETWDTRLNTWAAKRDEFANERVEAGQVVEVVRTVWTMRYNSSISPTDRIQYEGEVFDILGLMEVGRREGLRVMTEKRNSPR